MPDEVISVHARLYAERLMRGDPVSESEMHVIIAGLMLSVDKLVNAINRIDNSLWTESRLREIIGEEVSAHCLSQQKACKPERGFWASWLGRLLRSFAGMKCWAFGLCLLLALIGTGCASYGVRFDDGNPPTKRPYPATRIDCEAVSFLCTEFDFGFILALPVLVDLPFSLVSDTVLLPYDVIVYARK